MMPGVTRGLPQSTRPSAWLVSSLETVAYLASFGRTQSARRRIAASASGAVPARNWKMCCISGTTSSVTSTPDLLRTCQANFYSNLH